MIKLFPSKGQFRKWSTPSQVGYISFIIAVIAIFLMVIIFAIQMQTGATKEDDKITHAKLDDINEMIRRLGPAIADDTKRAIENIFLNILKTKDIPQWQWPEKLQEISARHQELLDKWNTVQSGDPAVDTLRDQARQMIELGDYDNADKFLRKAVDIDRKAIQSQQESLDNRKLSMSRSLANRADLAKTNLDYKKAIDLYKEALGILPQNQQTIQFVYTSNMAVLYYITANYKEAESAFRTVLSGDPDNTYAMGGIGNALLKLAKYQEAEEILKKALDIDINSDTNYINIARSTNSLGGWYYVQGKNTEAEPLLKRALEIKENVLGKDHPSVARSMNNLALLYYAQGKYTEAEPLFRGALAILEKVLGKDHPDVAILLNNLAGLYIDEGKYAEAEPLCQRALAILEKVLGKDHPDVAKPLSTLGNLYRAQSKYIEAESFYKRAVEIDENSLGPNHPDTIQFRKDRDICRSKM
jgi:tetratricopeptide (TPR) repeat protein